MKTRSMKVGTLPFGGDAPVLVQSMWKSRLDRLDEALYDRLAALRGMGCRIMRFACPTLQDAEALGDLARGLAERGIDLPLVADIHFDWRIALRCLDLPIAKVRINPGNIGERWKVEEVAAKAKDRGVPIRIGVNSGSLPKDLAERADRAGALVEAAEREAAVLEDCGFRDIVVSLKASDAATTVAANRAFAARSDIPLHLGVTEAGPLVPGIVKSTVALHALLSEGIGATLRVSLSDSEENEVLAAREILASTGRGGEGVTLVSCPRCGRNSFDSHDFARRWQGRLYSIERNLTIAVMGCVVNGPGEASHADLGITGAGDKVIIFSRGKILKTVEPEAADAEFESALSELLARGE